MPEEQEHGAIGRPRSGTVAQVRFRDEQVSALVKVTGRYPPRLAAELRELAAQRGEPLWFVLVLAAEQYLRALPRPEQERLRRRAHEDAHQLKQAAAEQYERNLQTKAQKRQAPRRRRRR